MKRYAWDDPTWAAKMKPNPIFPPAAHWECTTMAQKYGGTFAVSASATQLRKARTVALARPRAVAA